MKAHERRAAGLGAYYKLATWDARSFTWRDGKVAYDSEAEAMAAARRPGRYRLSRVADGGRSDLAPFER